MVFSCSSRAQLIGVFVLLALIPGTRSSHGLWRDPYGQEVAKDGPVAWWRFENAGIRGERLAECASCASPSPAECKVVPEWAGTMPSAVSGVVGIPGSNMAHPALDISPKVTLQSVHQPELAALNCTDPANANAPACAAVAPSVNCTDPVSANLTACNSTELSTDNATSANATNATAPLSATADAPAPSLGVLGRAASFPGRLPSGLQRLSLTHSIVRIC